jgi:hypothetical protein
LAREYADAFGTAIDRERTQLAQRPLYAEGAVLVRLSDHEAKLRRELQAATVAVTEVRAEYKRVYNHHLTQPGGLAS